MLKLGRQPKQSVMGFLLLIICALLAQRMLASAAVVASVRGESESAYPDNLPGRVESGSNEPLTLHKRPSFFVGSRYGRSNFANGNGNGNNGGGGGGGGGGHLKARRLIIVPRNDRFFLGSRYGKRNGGEFLSPYEQSSLRNSLASSVNSGNGASDGLNGTGRPVASLMSCAYTGLLDFYRCNNADELNHIVNQLTSEQNSEDSFEDNNTK